MCIDMGLCQSGIVFFFFFLISYVQLIRTEENMIVK